MRKAEIVAMNFEDEEMRAPAQGMADVGINVSGYYYAGDVYNASLVKAIQAGGYNFFASSGKKFVPDTWQPPEHYASVTSWGHGDDEVTPSSPKYYAQMEDGIIATFHLDDTHLDSMKSLVVGVYSNVSTEHVQSWLKAYADDTFMMMPEEEEPEEFTVRMGFYYFGARGAIYNTRDIKVHPWEETKRNYVPSVQAQVDALMAKETINEEDGKLLLMHGAPGGGKTHLIRTLAWAWRDWARFEIIIDPESFLGSAAYMTEIVMDDYVDGDFFRILVLEDSGEFIATHAKERTGQGMSRLLNLADGILGQGQPLGFCITTNEAVEQLEPAVTRPGRCLAQLEIPSFNEAQASEWLGYKADKPMMLADLYSTKNKSMANPTTLDVADLTIGQYI